MVLSLEGMSKSYGSRLVLQNVTAKIEDNDRIGLVGANGAGKSTLLNILTGDLDADDGTVSRSKVSIGFLRQNSGLSSDGTIHSEMRGVFAPLLEAEAELRDLEAQIAITDTSSEQYSELAAKYAQLQTVFEQRGGFMIDVRIATVLNGMGFLGVDTSTPVNVLSGGEKTRLALCKLLLEEPALLMLDEPTNHLDFRTLGWLEDYLQSYSGALLVVSHDRYFLDKLCTTMWEVEHHRLEAYPGNYSKYVLLKEERQERQLKEYDMQQKEIAEHEDFIARNLARASTTARARSRQKALERMEIIDRPKAPPRPPKLRFKYKHEPVKDVLHVENLTLAVGGGSEHKVLCENVGFDMMRGEKIALIGSNGVGKTTFLKSLQKLVPHESGTIEWGKNTDISYFEQEDFGLDSQKTVLNELWDRFPREYEQTIRTALGGVQLVGDNVFKKVCELSGGERARLKFAILLLSCGNVLLMDEPTNHLDLPTKEVLDEAMREYTGTLLAISHDRYLLNQFPTKIAEMHSDGFILYNGNYDSYLQQKANAEQKNEPAQTKEAPVANEFYRSKQQRSFEAARRREITQLEELIDHLEPEITRLEEEIASPEISSDYVLLQQRCDELEDCRSRLEKALSRWTEISE